MSKKEKTIKLIKQYISDLVLLLIFWGGILRTNYNADSLSHMLSKDADVIVNIRDGRYIIALCDYILLKAGIRTIDFIRLGEVVALLLFAFAMIIVQKIFREWEPQESLSRFTYYVAASFAFFNVLFVELLMFTEMPMYFAFAYLMASMAVYYYSRKNYILAFVCIILAATTYQYAVVYATVMLIFLVLMENDYVLSFKSIREYFMAGLFGFGGGLIDFISIELLSYFGIISSFRKETGYSDWATKLSDFFRTQMQFLRNCFGLLPALWIPLIALLIPVCLILIKKMRERKFIDGIHILGIILLCDVVLNVIPLMNTHYGFPGRMSFCLFHIIGLTYVIAFSILDIEKVRTILSYCFMGILIINMIFSHFILEDRFVSNTLDETYTSIFMNELENYEQNSGNTVTKIAIGYDDDSHLSYDRINFSGVQINERILSYAPISMIYYMSGREFERLSIDEETRNRLFIKTNWDEVNLDEQLCFEGDTAYWIIF